MRYFTTGPSQKFSQRKQETKSQVSKAKKGGSRLKKRRKEFLEKTKKANEPTKKENKPTNETNQLPKENSRLKKKQLTNKQLTVWAAARKMVDEEVELLDEPDTSYDRLQSKYDRMRRVGDRKLPAAKASQLQTLYHLRKNRRMSSKRNEAKRLAGRHEMLNLETAGYLEADSGDVTHRIKQKQIVEVVDVTSASKYFELSLREFGPYRAAYSRNGRHLLLAGQLGHVAAFDWLTKKLHCEFNVMEQVGDACWLHQETMFAVAQKMHTYIYDNQGVELHCLKRMDEVLRLEFLPYHFLLVSSNARGFLSYVDTSIGKEVATHYTKAGRLNMMCQNPTNAVIHLAHTNGTVTLWSPAVKDPLAKILCHRAPLRAVAVSADGNTMATSGSDRCFKLWDLRHDYRPLVSCRVVAAPTEMAFSQRNLLAASFGSLLQVYPAELTSTSVETASPYMSHRLSGQPYPVVSSARFCPFEDVLGVGHSLGFTSLLIPGSGEPNFDALEANPYESRKQRQHREVQMLLDKIQPELISTDQDVLRRVNRRAIAETAEATSKLRHVRSRAEHMQKAKFGKWRRIKERTRQRRAAAVATTNAPTDPLERDKRAALAKAKANLSRIAADKKAAEQTGDALARFQKRADRSKADKSKTNRSKADKAERPS